MAMRRLRPEERDHYAWLIFGLLAGARRLTDVPGSDALLRTTLAQIEELFLEVDALLADLADASVVAVPAGDEAAELERQMIASLLADAGEPEIVGHPVGEAELLEPQQQTADLLRAAIGQ